MQEFAEIEEDLWGYRTPYSSPEQIAASFPGRVADAIARYEVTTIACEPSTRVVGFKRVFAELTIGEPLYEALMNGRTGYRAQYLVSQTLGEAFNERLVTSVAAMLIESEQLYTEDVNRELCLRSLQGPFTKVWFPKEITDLANQARLLELEEVITAPAWVSYWRDRPAPRKGLLAPKAENYAVLLNGTFVRPEDWSMWEQKPERSGELHARGWT
jgi:hypothetical protein